MIFAHAAAFANALAGATASAIANALLQENRHDDHARP